MSSCDSFESIIDKARELEGIFNWIGSAELCQTALNTVPKQDVLKAGDVHERIGYTLFRAATQADNVEEFKRRMKLSVEFYDRAAELFEKVVPARSLYCRGMSRYSNSWFVQDPTQKKTLLNDCWRLMKKALENFDIAEDRLSYGKVFQGLSFCLWDRHIIEGDRRERRRIVEEGIMYGQNIIPKLSQTDNIKELAWAYTMTSFLMTHALDPFEERMKGLVSTISNYLKKALELSQKIEDVYLNFFLNYTLCVNSLDVTSDVQAALRRAEEVLQQGKKSNDHFLMGLAYFILNFITDQVAMAEEDPDKRKEKHNTAIQFAKESIHHSLLVCRYVQVSWAYSAYLIESYRELAELGTTSEEKRTLLKQAVEIGRKGSEYAKLSGSQGEMQLLFHCLSKAIFFLSEIETSLDEKKKLLEEALQLREKAIEIANQFFPPHDWSHGVYQNYLALIKADLAKMEENEEKKRHLLEEAVSSMEKCINVCTRYVQTAPISSRDFAVLGSYYDWFSDILDQLFSLTQDETVVSKTIKINHCAAEVYQKAGMPSRAAEAYWETARLYDRCGEYIKAADNFELASKNYQLAAEKIPQFKGFYDAHKSYMQAWTELEKAKLAHEREEYEQSERHYENATELLKPLKSWGYLAPYFSAWAKLEHAENLSRKEKSNEAIQGFQAAAHQFGEAETSLEEEAKKMERTDAKTKTLELSKISKSRKEYCVARVELEEANIHNKEGDHVSSARKYDAAAAKLEEIAEKTEDLSNRKEFLFQAHMCRALEKMELAEEKADPDLYSEASELFSKTQKVTTKKRNALLALGSACFCKALESGTRFKMTLSLDLYSTTKQYLERAADHFTEAGFENASKWTKATQRLFDAYVYMCNAESEVDPEKKARNYQLAEKHLDLSARLYERAGYISKRDETLRHLERVQEEKELLISLTEILMAPSIVSATPTISMPTPTNEEAIGVEGFEHANIQANLVINMKEVKVGEDLNLEIELVNAGKKPAQLIKTENIIPEGFEIKEKPEIYRVEDSCLNMKGKRLDPLKTQEVKLVLKASVKGTFTLKPRVLYLDETGECRSYEPEPATIKVKELGISGWLKGP